MTTNAWAKLVASDLANEQDFEKHWEAYQKLAARLGEEPAVWSPGLAVLRQANLTQALQAFGCNDFDELYELSLRQPEQLLQYYLKQVDVQFLQLPTQYLQSSDSEQAQWFVGAKLNIVDSYLQAPAEQLALCEASESGNIVSITYGELSKEVNRLCHALQQRGIVAGDAVAIIRPMDCLAVISYLAVIKLGAQVVAIADSFSSQAMATRLELANAKLILTQESIVRAGKRLPLYERVCEASKVTCVVSHCEWPKSLRQQDFSWEDLTDQVSDAVFPSIMMSPKDTIAVLFSSGTMSTPKAIPWNTNTALKAAMDAYFYQDIHSDDKVCWPTNLGWMMGHWLIFAGLLNRACIMLYPDSPTTRSFGEFVAKQGVTILGVVPSLVRSWQQSACIEGLDWSAIRLFSSSGEASNIKDMLYLMFLANYKPVIEYCGGTEIGGAYLTSTLLQPNYPARFSTPVLGGKLYLLDEHFNQSERGEVFLCPPMLGLSTCLLNKDHHEVYYAGLPLGPKGEVLRRHGDYLQQLANGYYGALGRCDDSMNLGGIKVSSAEIEQCLLGLPTVKEVAAVGVAPKGGGIEQLVLFVVAQGKVLKPEKMKEQLQMIIKEQLNPLFKIAKVVELDQLPKTDSNKIIRRQLKETF